MSPHIFFKPLLCTKSIKNGVLAIRNCTLTKTRSASSVSHWICLSLDNDVLLDLSLGC